MAKKIKPYHSRKFLNKKEGLGAIQITFEQWLYGGGCDGTVSINDCYRTVNVGFSAHDEKSLKETYDKLAGFIDELLKFQDYLSQNYETFEESFKEAREERKTANKERLTFTQLVGDLNDAK